MPWFGEFVVPLLDAYWACEMTQVRAAHERAVQSLEAEPDADYRKTKWLRLTVPWLIALMEYGEPEEGQQVLKEMMLGWSGEQPGPLSSEVARGTELMARLHLDTHVFSGR